MKFGYAAETIGDVAEYIREIMKLKSVGNVPPRSHNSRGMRSVHDAYGAGYNQACEDIAGMLELTTLSK